MLCDICKKDIVGANKNAIIASGTRAHKTCYAKLKGEIVVKPGADLKKYPQKATSKDLKESIADHAIGTVDEEYLKDFEDRGAEEVKEVKAGYGEDDPTRRVIIHAKFEKEDEEEK